MESSWETNKKYHQYFPEKDLPIIAFVQYFGNHFHIVHKTQGSGKEIRIMDFWKTRVRYVRFGQDLCTHKIYTVLLQAL